MRRLLRLSLFRDDPWGQGCFSSLRLGPLPLSPWLPLPIPAQPGLAVIDSTTVRAFQAAALSHHQQYD